MTDYVHPIYTPTEQRMRETFLTLMSALSYPGRTYMLPFTADPFTLIAESLLDLETSAFTPHAALMPALVASGARLLPANAAAYHFYELMDSAALDGIAAALVGTLNRPDESATLFIGGCTFGGGSRWVLSGAGINGTTAIRVDGISDRFWQLRASRMRHPLGWDVYLLDGRSVIGLPRTMTMIRG